MKPLLTLLTVLFSFCLSAQLLNGQDALFFAEQLHSREILSDYGYLMLQDEIKTEELAKRSQLLDKKFSIYNGDMRVSSLVAFVSHVYREEEHWRTAHYEVARLSQTFFGDPPPGKLSAQQQNELLAEARKRFGNRKGPMLEAKLGHDALADSTLAPYFMQFAKKARPQPDFEPLLSPKRAITGNDYLTTSALLLELGLILPEDLPEVDFSEEFGAVPIGSYYFSKIGTSVANREKYPERAAENRAFLEKAVSFGLLKQTTADRLAADSSIIGGNSKLPFYSAFEKRYTESKIGRRPDYETALPELLRSVQSLSADFTDARIDYQFTPNSSPPERNGMDGDDVTITLSVGGETYVSTKRTLRPLPGEETPFPRVDRELLDLFNRHLKAKGKDLIFFSICNLKIPEVKHSLLLLTDAEARSLIEWSMVDLIAGPQKYLQMGF